MTRASISRWVAAFAATSALTLHAQTQPFERSRTDGALDDGTSPQAERARQIEAATPRPNGKTAGMASPNALVKGLGQVVAAQGSHALENGTATIPFYGYAGNGPMIPATGDVQTSSHLVEATKTEPDKNTYLVVGNQTGGSPNYEYGTHFLFQGHENSSKDSTGSSQGYITRINLDADGFHRVTLMATADVDGKPLPLIDGSTWDPWAQRLLFTSETGPKGGVWQATLDVPSKVEDISGVLGRGSYEGIQNDSDGNLWIVEDVGGPSGTTNTHAKQPNSFLYRFLPKDRSNLKVGGKLQALQVASSSGSPIVFHAGQADSDILSPDVKDLHTYGKSFATRWVTIHDTDLDGTSPFDANAAAKAKGATPFKRPENGQFRPGSNFTQFFFDETGDTNAATEAGSAYGGFGSILRLSQPAPSAATGTLTLFYLGDVNHTGLDNVAFWDADHILLGEDAGDSLHTQRNMLDSAFLFDLTGDYSDAFENPPLRLLAQGRDPSATIDSGLSGQPGFQNDGDNELTGLHVSNGDPTPNGILGANIPTPFANGWRVFYTQQHGDNVTWEIVKTAPSPTLTSVAFSAGID
ncbi:MAG: alkaline phosphatase PhoX [Acidobacteriota bacterium]